MVTILSLAFATPALINKKPVRFPPDYDPLMIWVMAMFVFALAGAKGALAPSKKSIVSFLIK